MARFTRDDVDKFFDYGIDLAHRTIYMGSVTIEDGEESGVDAHMAERIIKALHILDQKNEPITIIMNNPGGSWYDGMAIYDSIKACQSHITIKVFGVAMSMGSIILQSADDRIMSPNSRFMIHYGNMGFDGHSKDFDKWAEENKKFNQCMEQILLDKAKLTKPSFTLVDLQGLLKHDTFFSAEEAVKMGWADKVL